MAPKQPPDERKFFEDIEKGLSDPSFSARLTSNPIYNAMVRDTISLTILQGGSKANVIPSESTATLDCRLIPGSSKEEFFERDQRKDWEMKLKSRGVWKGNPFHLLPLIRIFFRPSKNSPQKMIRVARSFLFFFPELRTAVFSGRRGIMTYDFCPFRLPEKEMLRVHGNDERIAIENLRFGMKMLVEIIKEIAT